MKPLKRLSGFLIFIGLCTLTGVYCGMSAEGFRPLILLPLRWLGMGLWLAWFVHCLDPKDPAPKPTTGSPRPTMDGGQVSQKN